MDIISQGKVPEGQEQRPDSKGKSVIRQFSKSSSILKPQGSRAARAVRIKASNSMCVMNIVVKTEKIAGRPCPIISRPCDEQWWCCFKLT